VELDQVVNVWIKREKFCFQKYMMINLNYRVITFVARVDGGDGGFSRITSGGGVFGGVGRSE